MEGLHCRPEDYCIRMQQYYITTVPPPCQGHPRTTTFVILSRVWPRRTWFLRSENPDFPLLLKVTPSEIWFSNAIALDVKRNLLTTHRGCVIIIMHTYASDTQQPRPTYPRAIHPYLAIRRAEASLALKGNIEHLLAAGKTQWAQPTRAHCCNVGEYLKGGHYAGMKSWHPRYQVRKLV